MTTPSSPASTHPAPTRSGDLSILIAAHDWAATLGARDTWPEMLRAAVQMMLASHQPAWLVWGPDSRLLYNDACAPLLGSRHPQALGETLGSVAPEWLAFVEQNDTEPLPLIVRTGEGPQQRHYQFTATALQMESGVLCLGRDLTGRRAGEREQPPALNDAASAAHAMLPNFLEEPARRPTGSAGHGGDRRPRIVLVDDDADTREHLSQLLATEYEVVTAADGREALHAIVEERPALILTEVMMPRLDGLGLLRAIRRNSRLSGIPVIMLSARASDDASSEGFASGANDYLLKPVNARDLMSRIASQLAQARARDEALLRERALRDEAEGLNEISRELAAELHVPTLIDKISAIAIRLTGAQFGAFLRSTMNENSPPGDLDAVSAHARETLDRLGLRPDSALFAPTFQGAPPIRAADLGRHASYRHHRAANAPGVLSYLAVPVVTRSGEVLGGLFFGHTDADVFTPHAERYAVGIAAQAAVALDNGRLYAQLRTELRERERAQRDLRASEQWYRAIGESIRYGVWICDEHGRNTYASPSFLKLLGISQAEYSRDGWRNVLHPDDLDAVDSAWKHCVRTGGQWDRELRLRDADGHWQYVLSRGVPVYSGSGAVSGWAGINLEFSRVRRAEDELREADRRKDEFLATLAHELRNPLAPLRNGLQIMRSAPDDTTLVNNAREMMERQLQQMVRLIDDLLDLSRISRGKIELKQEVVDVEMMIRNALETTRALIDDGGHALRLQFPPQGLQVHGDMTRLSQVIVNLLDNAAKYSMPGQEIDIEVAADEKHIAITVRDHGIGIPREMLPRVFDMFTQINRSLERSQGGLGIGLSIVKRIIELHGGTVEVRSAGHKCGSEFVVRLRRTYAQPAPAAIAPAATGAAANQRVLVVDDNIDAAQSLATILQFEGCDTQIAHDGEAALDLARSFLPDAVVLDIGLPQISGYEICRRMRQQPWGRDMVIIALTGWGQDEHRRRSHEAGFDHHLVKPVDPTLLSELLLAMRKRTTQDATPVADRRVT